MGAAIDGVAVVDVVRSRAPAAAPVLRRVEEPHPAAADGPGDLRVRIDALDGCRVADADTRQVVVAGVVRVHVAMHELPVVRLVVEVVERDAPATRAAVSLHQVLHPLAGELGADRDARVVRVGDDVGAVRADAVAAVRVERIGRLLRPVFRDTEPARVLALRGPAHHRHRPHRQRAGTAIALDGVVELRDVWIAGVGVRVGQKVVVARGVVDVELPVVARGGVAAPAFERQADHRRDLVERGRVLVHAVNERVDGVPVRACVDHQVRADGGRRRLERDDGAGGLRRVGLACRGHGDRRRCGVRRHVNAARRDSPRARAAAGDVIDGPGDGSINARGRGHRRAERQRAADLHRRGRRRDRHRRHPARGAWPRDRSVSAPAPSKREKQSCRQPPIRQPVVSPLKGPWVYGSIGSWVRERAFRCTHAPMHPCTHAPMHPCTHAPMNPCTHGPMHPWTYLSSTSAASPKM